MRFIAFINHGQRRWLLKFWRDHSPYRLLNVGWNPYGRVLAIFKFRICLTPFSLSGSRKLTITKELHLVVLGRSLTIILRLRDGRPILMRMSRLRKFLRG
ncbi:hypothetical protein LINPERHAP1_LOCUS429 [Linum perenne]